MNEILTFHLTHSVLTRMYQNGSRITIVQNFHYTLLYTPVFQAHPQTLILPAQLFRGLLGLPTKEHVDLLFNPVFVIGLVCQGISSVNETAEVCQIINKIKQLADIICDRGAVGIHSLQMFFIHFTNTVHAFTRRITVSIRFAFRPLGRQAVAVKWCETSCQTLLLPPPLHHLK